MDLSFNKIFWFFLNKKGVAPKFKKTENGYQTYDKKWNLSIEQMCITHLKPVKVFNGCDYDKCYEETRFSIVKKEESIDIVFLFTKLI